MACMLLAQNLQTEEYTTVLACEVSPDVAVPIAVREQIYNDALARLASLAWLHLHQAALADDAQYAGVKPDIRENFNTNAKSHKDLQWDSHLIVTVPTTVARACVYLPS